MQEWLSYFNQSMSTLESVVLLVTLAVAIRAIPLASKAWRERRWAKRSGDANPGEYAVAMWRFDNNIVKIVTVWCLFLLAVYSSVIPPPPPRLVDTNDIPQMVSNLRRMGTVLTPLLIVLPSIFVAWSNERAYKWRRDQGTYLLQLRGAASVRSKRETEEAQAQRDQADRTEHFAEEGVILSREASKAATAAAIRSDAAHKEAKEANKALTSLGEKLNEAREGDRGEVDHIKGTTDATKAVAEETLSRLDGAKE